MLRCIIPLKQVKQWQVDAVLYLCSSSSSWRLYSASCFKMAALLSLMGQLLAWHNQKNAHTPEDIISTLVDIHPCHTGDWSTEAREIIRSHLFIGKRSRGMKWAELEFWIQVLLNLSRHCLRDKRPEMWTDSELSADWVNASYLKVHAGEFNVKLFKSRGEDPSSLLVFI